LAQMRQDVDRRVDEEFDIVGAALQRALDVAGIIDIEKVQHALPMQFLGHIVSTVVFAPDSRSACIIFNGMRPISTGKTRFTMQNGNRTAQQSLSMRFSSWSHQIMKTPLAIFAAVAALTLAAHPADAKGCIKGAVVGGVGGHYAG